MPTAPDEDVSEDVERHRVVKNLETAGGLDEEKAKSLAEQIIAARRENSQLREQKLFLLFNGRYLMSSDGRLLLDAVSGKPVSIKEKEVSVNTAASLKTVRKIKFDYSYQRQAKKMKVHCRRDCTVLDAKKAVPLQKGT